MANFSVNQVRQLYVAESLETSITSASPEKGIQVVTGADSQLYFIYQGADGPLRSDLIDLSKITYAKAISADDLRRPLKKVSVKLEPTVNGGVPLAGQIYVLGINILEYGSLSPEDTYYKNVAITGTTGMTAAQFYTALEAALKLSFKRETIEMFKFTASATELLIEEVEQPWRRGVKSSEALMFNVVTGQVFDGTFESNWGAVTSVTPTAFIENGKITADLEYFTAGERGDIYRGVCFPDNIETTYFVDPTKNYHYIELQFHYNGTGNAVQESQKHLTIVSPDKTVANSIITAINGVAGTTLLNTIP